MKRGGEKSAALNWSSRKERVARKERWARRARAAKASMPFVGCAKTNSSRDPCSDAARRTKATRADVSRLPPS